MINYFKKSMSIILLMMLSCSTPEVLGDRQERKEKRQERRKKRKERRAARRDTARCRERCKPQLEEYINQEVDRIVETNKKRGFKQEPREMIAAIKTALKALYQPKCSINKKAVRMAMYGGVGITTGGLALAAAAPVVSLGFLPGLLTPVGGTEMYLRFGGALIAGGKQVTENNLNASLTAKEFLKKHDRAFNIRGGNTVLRDIFGTRCWGVANGKDSPLFAPADESETEYMPEEEE